MSIFVHVGFHKTNTTWLQKRFFNRADSGFWPVSENAGDCREFGWEFLYGSGTNENRQGRLDSPFDFSADRLRERLKRLCSRSQGYPVISHEDLSGHIWSGGYTKREIADRIRAVAPNARILITIREQLSLIRSSYYHYLWNGGICSLKAYITTHNEYQVPLFNPRHLFFDEFVVYYQQLFGRKNVLVLAYEDFCSNPNDFLEEIYGFLGLQSVPHSMFEIARRLNTRGKELNYLQQKARWLNVLGSSNNLNWRIAVGSTRRKQKFLKSVARLMPATVAAKKHSDNFDFLETALGGLYAQSNRMLQKNIGKDLASLGYRVG